jgi:hypothetical protein
VKTISSTLKTHLERWDDPGDYPSGAGGGPLASRWFVEGVYGNIVVELTSEERADIGDGLAIALGSSYRTAAQDYLDDHCGEVKHEIPGLTVSKWDVEKAENYILTLAVVEFEMEDPGPPEREYERD